VVDTKKEHIAVSEARKLGIPVIAILDTNCDPDEVTYPIPGNDDAIRSVSLLTRVVADAVADGLIARAGASANGEDKPAVSAGAGELGAEEPLAEWERELLEHSSADAAGTATTPNAAEGAGAAETAGAASTAAAEAANTPEAAEAASTPAAAQAAGTPEAAEASAAAAADAASGSDQPGSDQPGGDEAGRDEAGAAVGAGQDGAAAAAERSRPGTPVHD
jgi:small subunit ribosomal protein S2